MKNVMIDLETMGLRPNSAILQIGAVEFDTSTKAITSEFVQNVQLFGQAELGFHISDDTHAWWAKQDRDLRDSLTKDAVPITEAVMKFHDWIMYGVIDKSEITPWSNGAGFDIPIMEHAYERVGISPPWPYYNISCYRTLKRIYKSVRLEFTGRKHHALDDARHQAKQLMEIMSVMARPGDMR